MKLNDVWENEEMYERKNDRIVLGRSAEEYERVVKGGGGRRRRTTTTTTTKASKTKKKKKGDAQKKKRRGGRTGRISFDEEGGDDDPEYRVELARSNRSRCVATAGGPACEHADAKIEKDEIRCGHRNPTSGSLWELVDLRCVTGAKRVRLGLPDARLGPLEKRERKKKKRDEEEEIKKTKTTTKRRGRSDECEEEHNRPWIDVSPSSKKKKKKKVSLL